MTRSTVEAAGIAGCDALMARRLGVAMKGRPPEPLWNEADVRHLCAAVALAADSPSKFYSDADLVRITRSARHRFVHFIIVRARAGIGVRDVHRAVEVIGQDRTPARVIALDDEVRVAVAS